MKGDLILNESSTRQSVLAKQASCTTPFRLLLMAQRTFSSKELHFRHTNQQL
jgi:hypothetical protein